MARIIKLLKIIIAVILIPAFLIAGGYGFVYWKITSSADSFAKEISPFAKMTYQDVHIDILETEVGLKNISLEPVGSQGHILVESLRMKAPSWLYYLDFESQISSGGLPDSLDLKMQGLIVDLQSGYMNDLASQTLGLQGESIQSYDALACGDRTHFSLTDLKKMRYNALKSDVSLLYYFDPNNQTLNFDLDTATALMMDMSAELEIAVSGSDLKMQTLMFAQPSMKRLELRYKDRGFNKRRMIFCAKETGKSEAEYRSFYRQELQAYLTAQGWQIPDALYDDYDKINNPSGSLFARIEHPTGFNAQTMVLIQKPTDILAVLDPYVEINGKPVDMGGIRWEMPDPTNTQLSTKQLSGPTEIVQDKADVAEDGDEADAPEAVKPRKKSSFDRPKVKSFKPVSVSSLRSHIGQKVKLFTYFGRNIEGTLISVTSSVVKVEHRLVDGRGTAIYPIALDKIQTAKLYH
ncbi:MAG: hypothetical protein ACPF9K_02130 [Neptuniibacter sp.]